jgi:hypothetical protein
MGLKRLLFSLILTSFIHSADSISVSQYEPSSISYGIENDFLNQYIWHGIIYNEGLILQPSVWISKDNISFSVWGNITSYDVNSAIKRNEIDFFVEYYNELENFELESSLGYYIYPKQEDSPPTAEANLKLLYNVFESKLYTNLTLDVLEYPGSFTGELGIIHEVNINDDLNLFLDINASVANKKFNETNIDSYYSHNSLNYLSFSLSSNYYFTDVLYIKPHFGYYHILNSALKEISGNHLLNFGLLIGTEL